MGSRPPGPTRTERRLSALGHVDDPRALLVVRPCAIMMLVPLSEDEQRILREIEDKLIESDPDLAREVGTTTVYSHAFRNLKWSALLFLVGVIAMIGLLSTSFVYAFGGFLVMLVAALIFERNARRMGKAGLQQATHSMHAAGLREYFGGTSQRMRERFKREDE